MRAWLRRSQRLPLPLGLMSGSVVGASGPVMGAKGRVKGRVTWPLGRGVVGGVVSGEGTLLGMGGASGSARGREMDGNGCEMAMAGGGTSGVSSPRSLGGAAWGASYWGASLAARTGGSDVGVPAGMVSVGTTAGGSDGTTEDAEDAAGLEDGAMKGAVVGAGVALMVSLGAAGVADSAGESGEVIADSAGESGEVIADSAGESPRPPAPSPMRGEGAWGVADSAGDSGEGMMGSGWAWACRAMPPAARATPASPSSVSVGPLSGN
jgi:hypothetical protein